LKITRLRIALSLSLLVGVLTMLAVSSPSAAATTQAEPNSSTTTIAPKKSCAAAIVDDWYPDGRVDKLYPIPCYEQAIKSLPTDLQIYGQAEEDIRRAQQFAKDERPDPGRKATTTPTETDPPPTDTGGGAPPTDPGPNPPAADASSVPVPLIVLGGLAVLLVAAGGAGYLNRRMRREETPEGDTVPDP
jgi:Alphavirus glycoprotein J